MLLLAWATSPPTLAVTISNGSLLRDTANYVSDSVSGALSGASSEANKSVAKDSDASLGTRASAAKDSVGDKMDQKSSEVST